MPTKYLHPAYHYISTLLHPLMKLYHFVMCYTPYYPTYQKSLLQLGFTHCITPHMKNHCYSYVLHTILPHIWKIIITVLGFTHPITPHMKNHYYSYDLHTLLPQIWNSIILLCFTPYYPTYEKSLLQLGFTHCITPHIWKIIITVIFYTPYYPTYEKSL